MAYKSLIDSQLAIAFNQLKDLAVPVLFEGVSVEGYDFAAMAPDVSSAPQVSLKAVVLGEKKEEGKITAELLFKSRDLENPSEHSRVTFEGNSWVVGPVLAQKRYITLVKVWRAS